MSHKAACASCGSTTYSHWRKIYPNKDLPYEVCNNCECLVRPRVYDDVYKGDCGKGLTTDPNICDPDTGKEIPYSSPGEKASIMKRLNICQSPSAERQHGSRNETVRRTYSIG